MISRKKNKMDQRQMKRKTTKDERQNSQKASAGSARIKSYEIYIQRYCIILLVSTGQTHTHT